MQHSEAFSIGSGDNLQARASMPDVAIRHDLPKKALVMPLEVKDHVAEIEKPDTWAPDLF